MTVVGLVNGMIGGIILVLPILALETGTLLIVLISITSGFFSYFSCLLCLRHLKNYSDLDEAIYYHFGQQRKYKVFYDAIIMISMSAILILYFDLICEQWQGITEPSHLIAILNAVVLFPIVYIMKKMDFGVSLLAYGILSIVGTCFILLGYVCFLIWMLFTTEPGPKQVPAADPLFVDYAAALAQGFAIQTFFIPILHKRGARHLYKKILGVTYVVGILIYTFISYSGAYSIVNR